MKQLTAFVKSVINSYSVLFFSQNRVLGIVLLLVSFFNTTSGFAGLGCVVFSLLMCRLLKFYGDDLQLGIYSFNSLLLGVAFGAFYQVNLMFVIWLVVACGMVIMASIIISQRLGKLGLPMLSLPFILVFWLVLLASNSIFSMGLLQKSSYLLEEIYTGPGNIAGIEGYLASALPQTVGLFFRSLSAILFQQSVFTGMFISLGMLIHSRIAFSLLVIGFFAAIGLNAVTHTYPEGISYYHLGANYMMASVAIGSFFTIPSARSYLLAVVSIPLNFLIINGLTGFISVHALPVFSLPFCIVNISLVYFLMLRKSAGKLQLTGIQHYSPERNLYQFLNHQERLSDLKYLKINLPFMGFWTVSQGYNGSITHKGDWAQALDFVIRDEDDNTYQYPGTLPEHFYCFSKPVLACGDGVVEVVVNNVDDNAIGKENLKENWGNTVVLRHAIGLYSKVSHLKKNSIKVKPGDFVKQGDLLGLCGNSGRSPEPHLHFQLQATPYIGSKTLRYPFAGYISRKENKNSFLSHNIPTENDLVVNPEVSAGLKKAFDFQPGYNVQISADNGITAHWEVFKDELGQSYIYNKTSGSAAYFINNGNQFYFTSFYGDKKSLLYYFYLAAYQIILIDDGGIVVNDTFPLHISDNKLLLFIQDFVSPFYRFFCIGYKNNNVITQTGLRIQANQYRKMAGKETPLMTAALRIEHSRLQGLEINFNGEQIKAQWSTEN